MTVVRETVLPGVGVRHEFTNAEGVDVAVIIHHDGRREILTYGRDDPDACTSHLSLSEHDTQTIAEILGVSHVEENLAEIRQDVEGLAIEWLDVASGAPLDGAELGGALVPGTNDTSIVAIIRDETPILSPGPKVVFAKGDVVVAVGTHQGVSELRTLLGH